MKTIILGLLLTVAAPFVSAEYSRSYIESHPLETVAVNGIEMAYRIVGQNPDSPKIVIIMGLGGSNLVWGDTLVKGLEEGGYELLMFDNRDVGGSTSFDDWGQPTLWLQLIKQKIGLPVNAPYTLDDMATDTVALMDALEYQDAHIIGTSMGGMIAQVVAAQYPQRTRSLVSIMSSTGARHLPWPTRQAEGNLRELAGGDAAAERDAMMRARGFYPESMPRQLMAIFKSGDRSADVASIQASTLVMHGVDDTLVPPPHGVHTAELIEGSEFVLLEDMGHNMPDNVMPELISRMRGHMDKFEAAADAGRQ
ncbi:alpha/beta hydrolase [Porticoccaceae bacterium]|jgi:pimeloyl-ACP methyl ester carboxylesterase|nr:alpha/beta hydrolase [Porticoccaceae bacterium]MDB9949372.1 alpha/beta hydrolase [Porticoccaceae bacterium]MDB9969861.1 alpha/beta hydrolase [Porticoccaceae bacterium]MDC0010648.1 alpha/beta hydrolase [Porticoccaceae bacterium]